VVWLGRVGYGPAAQARSTRRRRTELLLDDTGSALPHGGAHG